MLILCCLKPLLYCTLLYSTVLYSTVLNCSLLYSTLLYSTLLYSTLLYSSLLYSNLLYSTPLYSTLLYLTLLQELHVRTVNHGSKKFFTKLLIFFIFLGCGEHIEREHTYGRSSCTVRCALPPVQLWVSVHTIIHYLDSRTVLIHLTAPPSLLSLSSAVCTAITSLY
jgi:hypothetical protein